MKKNGFTLIEIMAVIFILGIVMTLVIVSVDKTIKDNKESLYQTQIDNIEDAARTWGNAHINLIPDEKGDAISIPLMILKQDGLVDKNLKNPKTEELFFDNMYIDISYENGQYIYDVIEDSGTKIYSDLSYPVIILKEKFNTVEYAHSNEVLISTLDRQILNDTLTSTNNTTNKTLTLSYTESGKTFEVVRNKIKTCLLSKGTSMHIGSEYRCNLGDNIERTFYILEISEGTVSLIMNQNLGDNVAWSSDGYNHKDDAESTQATTAKIALADRTIGWTNLDSEQIKLPSAQQIATAGGDTEWVEDGSDTGYNLPSWLTGYLDSDDGIWGYWTSTPDMSENQYVWYVDSNGFLDVDTPEREEYYGLRPVITLSEDDIN